MRDFEQNAGVLDWMKQTVESVNSVLKGVMNSVRRSVLPLVAAIACGGDVDKAEDTGSGAVFLETAGLETEDEEEGCFADVYVADGCVGEECETAQVCRDWDWYLQEDVPTGVSVANCVPGSLIGGAARYRLNEIRDLIPGLHLIPLDEVLDLGAQYAALGLANDACNGEATQSGMDLSLQYNNTNLVWVLTESVKNNIFRGYLISKYFDNFGLGSNYFASAVHISDPNFDNVEPGYMLPYPAEREWPIELVGPVLSLYADEVGVFEPVESEVSVRVEFNNVEFDSSAVSVRVDNGNLDGHPTALEITLDDYEVQPGRYEVSVEGLKGGGSYNWFFVVRDCDQRILPESVEVECLPDLRRSAEPSLGDQESGVFF
ncbi:hypothetical protein HOD30_02940 [Candidatus Peregrinibacteria bacterium]|jgi:hypothetical protein|nr:hypothetical protein [Candidatus Peregrinibacteria bacterium]MBT4632050.1 hypothetical protein [Candidatus Peregrinibacteria bacterium]MBT5823704.1 hypothetical protein [Candidatus Peregrinibacteria bacterium]